MLGPDALVQCFSRNTHLFLSVMYNCQIVAEKECKVHLLFEAKNSCFAAFRKTTGLRRSDVSLEKYATAKQEFEQRLLS